MRTAVMAVVLLGLGACGGEDEPSLDGNWMFQINSACSAVTSFGVAEGKYSAEVVCAVQGGGFGTDVEVGDADYSQAGSVTMAPRSASCPTRAHSPGAARWSISHGQLSLVGDTGVLVFERMPDGPRATGILSVGCWDMGKFTPSPLKAL